MSIQKQSKKSNKFSYLTNQQNSTKLLGHYENSQLNSRPIMRTYQIQDIQTQQNNKQNHNLNEAFKTKIQKNHFLNIKHIQDQSNRNQFASFSKSHTNFNNNNLQIKTKQDKIKEVLVQDNVLKNRLFNSTEQSNYEKRINKGKISSLNRKNNQKVQFSPYQQDSNYQTKKQQQIENKNKLFQSYDAANHLRTGKLTNFKVPNIRQSNKNEQQYHRMNDLHNCYQSLPYKPEQNMLIYQLRQQIYILKSQLKQQEYQNELLRQKTYHFELENSQLKNQIQNRNQQFIRQFQERQCLYLKQIQTLNQLIREVQNSKELLIQQKHSLEAQNNQILAINKNINAQIKGLQQKVQLLLQKQLGYQIMLQQKQQKIISLLTKLQIQINNNEDSDKTNKYIKRRKSLDLNRKYPINYLQINKHQKSNQHEGNQFKQYNQSYKNHISQINENYEKVMKNDLARQEYNRSEHIGKLMNKSLNPSPQKHRNQQFNQNLFNQITVRQLNFIDSIKSMYFKINNKQSQDLKQIWKWLKFIAHSSQSFGSLIPMKDSINAVFDDFQAKQQQQGDKQLSFMQKQCFKIIRKLYALINKPQM